MNALQEQMQLWRDIEQTQWGWIRHDQSVKSEERFTRTFGRMGETADSKRQLRFDRKVK